MHDHFHVMGDDVYLRGILVASLSVSVPATIREAAEALLDAANTEDDGAEGLINELCEATDKRDEARARVSELEREIENLKALLRSATP